MSILYICYQSLLEPLTQTQVVAYLEGLAATGYGVVLLTFEPEALGSSDAAAWRERMSARGITWHWRRYHKWPSAPATAWDVMAGILAGQRLIRQHEVRVVHARAHVPGLMGLALKKLTGVKLLFDVRGLMAEEYVDAGIWPSGGLLFRLTKRAERAVLCAADGLVVLTRRAKVILQEWYPREMAGKPLEVIPCCVDMRLIPAPPAKNLPATASSRTLVYVGKVGGWYLTEAMVAFFAEAVRMLPELKWKVLTQSNPDVLREMLKPSGLDERVTFSEVSPERLPFELASAMAGLSFIKPCLSKQASSPTKIAEYLAAGLPVISSAGIGDTDEMLSGKSQDSQQLRLPAGVLISEYNDIAYSQAVQELMVLLDDSDTPRRCRALAEEHFDLEHVGWPRYRRLYAALLGQASSGAIELGTIAS